MNPKVDAYIRREKKWAAEFTRLRAIILDCKGLTEDFKWGHPCYSHDDKNVVLMHGFKEYCALLFPKGVLLKDPRKILIQQTANVQSARQVRFQNVEQIQQQQKVLKAYVLEALKLEKSGAKVEFKKTAQFPMPEEFRSRLQKDRALKTAFEGLTPGRQRGYLLHFSSAKQAKTREARIEKYIPAILDGLGLDD